MKVLFFLFAAGTCQVTWKGKSGKWLVIFDNYRLFSTLLHELPTEIGRRIIFGSSLGRLEVRLL